jgi:hypothetical protein
MMKLAPGTGFGLLMLAGLCASPLAVHAQGIPPAATLAALNCGDLHREAADLRFRLDNTLDPIEHAQLAGYLHQVHNEEDNCGP